MEASWNEFKVVATSRNLSIQYVYIGANIHMRLIDGAFILECAIPSDVTHSDNIDFTTNFKATGNKRQSQTDSDGAVISRGKTTRTGWHYEPRSLDFLTSTAESLYNREHNGTGMYDGTSYGDGALHFFDGSGAELTQAAGETLSEFQTRLDAGCVRTHLDWQSSVEIDAISCSICVNNPPVGNEQARAWIVVAPDIPSSMGGSVPLLAGGLNLRFLIKGVPTIIDGKGVKTFTPDFTYNSNKVRVVIKHDLAAKIEMEFIVGKFNA